MNFTVMTLRMIKSNHMTNIKISIFILVILGSMSVFGAEYGSVMTYKNGKPTVEILELAPTTGNTLKNALLTFVDPPELKKDQNNCFCYDIKDIRFAYVQAYYHATKQLNFYLPRLKNFNVTLVTPLRIKLTLVPGQPAWGMVSETNLIEFEIPEPAFDHTLLAHEVSHIIHQLLGAPLTISIKGQSRSYDQEISEGTGNILAALYLNSPLVGEFSPSPLNVNLFIKEPDIFTNRMQYETYYLISPEMKEKFPELIQKVKDTIKEGEASADSYILDLPCPYVQSNVINQPIWLAAQKFGRDEVIDLYLKAINDNSTVKSYSDFAQRILDHVNDNELLKKYLATEFIRHGLSIE
jgi:hypothetical protein